MTRICSIFLSALPWRRMRLLFGTKVLYKCSHMCMGDGVLLCSCSFVLFSVERRVNSPGRIVTVLSSSSVLLVFVSCILRLIFQIVKVLCFAEPHDHITFSFIPDSFYIGFLFNVCLVCFSIPNICGNYSIIKCFSCIQHNTSLFNPL